MNDRSKRPLKVRVKTGKSRSLSSKLWLERQLNDPYVGRAKREGLRSRAAYKLMEIDDKHHFLKGGARVVDLGAAPGGWSQVASKRVGVGDGRGRVVALDLLDMAPIAGVEFIHLDFLDAGRARADQGAARRAGRYRALRHGSECDRPSQDRPHQDHGAGRGGGGICTRGARPRRRVPLQGAAGRHRGRRCSPRSSATSPASSM